MNMTDTLKGSYFAEVFPKGWDIEKIAACVSQLPESVTQPQPFWNPAFRPVACENLEEFGAYMGHEIAMQIRKTKEEGRKLILILPVGPMGMYKWAVYFLKEWNVDCKHVYGFNMDEWSDAEGNTLPASDPAAFQNAMVNAFYGPLGELTVPEEQRNFATKENLPTYAEKIAALKAEGAKQVLVYGIGRMCHIAFWEPHFADEYETEEAWLAEPCRIGARLHRAERHHVLPLLVAAHPVLREYHRPEDHLRLGLRHRRRGRRAVARYAVAGHELLDDPPLRPHEGRDLQPHPDHARQAVLYAGAGRPAVRGYKLNQY